MLAMLPPDKGTATWARTIESGFRLFCHGNSERHDTGLFRARRRVRRFGQPRSGFRIVERAYALQLATE